jgi:hypothetical protein
MLLKKRFWGGGGFLTLVLFEKKILNETKNHNTPPPPWELNGRWVPNCKPKLTGFAGETLAWAAGPRAYQGFKLI